jgi:predicted dienelactone hydrolase
MRGYSTVMEQSAGLRVMRIADEVTGTSSEAVVMYPSTTEEGEHRIAQFGFCGALNGECAEGRFPLVVVSHGSGGSHLLYRTLARQLARNGYVVVSAEHWGNNRHNNDLAGTERLLAERPRQLRRVIDRMMEDEELGPRLFEDRVAVVGHSLGGYTGLALAGGRPRATGFDRREGGFEMGESFRDGRVQAVVLLAPATVWYGAEGALEEVDVPVLMMSAEADAITGPYHAEIVTNGLPEETVLEHVVVPGAGHFSFLAPFPQEMVDSRFLPSQDPEGFDRVAFQERMAGVVLRFLRKYL